MPLKPFDRRDLIAAVREVLPTRSTRAQVDAAIAAIDVVLSAVERQVTPLVEREWSGVEVLKRIRNLKSNPQSKE